MGQQWGMGGSERGLGCGKAFGELKGVVWGWEDINVLR